MISEKTIMIIAGEASGDLHASHLVRKMTEVEPQLNFFGVGGQKMEAAGVQLIFANHEIAVTGFSEVLSKIGKIRKAYRAVRKTLRDRPPDLLILLDFPDFNLRVAKMAKKMGIPVLYYISPQVWAWRRNRIGLIRKLVEKIMVVLPFEASLYGEKGIFVGHPLLDIVTPSQTPGEIMDHLGIQRGSPVVTLLPGSRKNEVDKLLPVMVEAAHMIRERITDVQFVLPIASTISKEDVTVLLEDALVPIIPVQEQAYDALSVSDFAIVASGTATLETAILGVPMLILYRMSALTYALARRLVRVPHIGLINMVAGKRIVPELIQSEVTPNHIMEETLQVLENGEYAAQISRKLREAVIKLGSPGTSARAARIAIDLLEEKG
ncbi:MAG: lipid-A-disaccharide synthase [Deltaproteobacteria bacterium]|nr:lipid-A-disaccharide synthase [Deltaproteobacteria bacterium]